MWKNKPIVQTGYGIRHKMLTTTKCGCNVYNKMADTSTKQYLEEKSDHIYTANKNATHKITSNVNCSKFYKFNCWFRWWWRKKFKFKYWAFNKCIVTKDAPVAKNSGSTD